MTRVGRGLWGQSNWVVKLAKVGRKEVELNEAGVSPGRLDLSKPGRFGRIIGFTPEEVVGILHRVCNRSRPVQIKISSRHGSVSDGTRTKMTEKLERLTRYFDRLTAIDVTIDLERREEPSVDLRVSAEHKHDFVATARSGDLMASLDLAIHKLEQQLRKYKQRIQERHRSVPPRESQVPGDLEALS